jgi:hypothetical protein
LILFLKYLNSFSINLEEFDNLYHACLYVIISLMEKSMFANMVINLFSFLFLFFSTFEIINFINNLINFSFIINKLKHIL